MHVRHVGLSVIYYTVHNCIVRFIPGIHIICIIFAHILFIIIYTVQFIMKGTPLDSSYLYFDYDRLHKRPRYSF